MDLPNAHENLKKFQNNFKDLEIIEVSAINNTGFDNLMLSLANLLDTIKDNEIDETELASHVVYKYQNEKPFTIHKENDLWVLEGKELEKLFKMTKFNEDDAVIRFGRILKGMGVEEELERLGAKRGDNVLICDYVFEFKE